MQFFIIFLCGAKESKTTLRKEAYYFPCPPPVFYFNPAAAKFEWKIISLPVGNLHDSWPRKLFKQL